MIVFLGVLGLLAWLAEKYSMDHVLDGLDFATALDKTVVEPGEDFSWTMTINNRKHLMVPLSPDEGADPRRACLF